MNKVTSPHTSFEQFFREWSRHRIVVVGGKAIYRKYIGEEVELTKEAIQDIKNISRKRFEKKVKKLGHVSKMASGDNALIYVDSREDCFAYMVVQNGRCIERSGDGEFEDVYATRIDAMISALRLLDENIQRVKILCANTPHVHTYRFYFIERWHDKGWIKQDGQRLEHADKWSEFYNLCKRFVHVSVEEHVPRRQREYLHLQQQTEYIHSLAWEHMDEYECDELGMRIEE